MRLVKVPNLVFLVHIIFAVFQTLFKLFYIPIFNQGKDARLFGRVTHLGFTRISGCACNPGARVISPPGSMTVTNSCLSSVKSVSSQKKIGASLKNHNHASNVQDRGFAYTSALSAHSFQKGIPRASPDISCAISVFGVKQIHLYK